MENGWSSRFRYTMLAVVVIGVVALIWYARVVIAPLIVSALIAYLLNTVVEVLVHRTRLSRRLSVWIVYMLGLVLLLATPALIIPVLVAEVQDLVADLDVFLASVQNFLASNYVFLGQTFSPGQFIPDLTSLFSAGLAGVTVDALQIIEATTRNFLWFLVILASTYSLMKDWGRLREWLIDLAPAHAQDDVRRIYQEIKRIWRGYLRGNLALMIVTGVLFTIAWLAIGVPAALLLGLIAGLLTIIPDIGPAFAAILAILVSLVEGSTLLNISNILFALLVFVVYMVLINIKNIWIRPRIFGRSVHMHDGLVFIAIVAAIVIQGVLGALIVIPVLASLGVITRYIWNQILGEDPFPVPAWRRRQMEALEAVEEPQDGAVEEEALVE